mgnify:CR=1 FL=1
MTNRIIYDRENLCQEIIDQIESSNETQGIILYSQIGIGKTSVCRKVESIMNKKTQRNILKIISPQENNNTQEGAFLKNIFSCMDRYYEKKSIESDLGHKNKYKKFRFRNFLKRKVTLSTMIQSIIVDSNDIIKSYEKPILMILYFLKAFCKYIMLKMGLFKNIDESFKQNNKLISDYIKYVLSSGDIILNIDNVQNFDSLSFETFIDCLLDQKEKENFFIFEFTLYEDNTNYVCLEQMKHFFEQANIKISVIRLDNLDIEYVIRVAHNYCPDKDELFDVIVKDNFKNKYKGNLKKVEHFASIYTEGISIDIDPTLVKLKALCPKQLYILALVIINNASIKANILKYILQNGNNDFLIDFTTDVMNFCQNGEFIQFVDDNIGIVHSSIIDVWNENIQVFKKYELLAYRNSEIIYKKILCNNLFQNISKPECLLLLLKLYSKFEVAKMSEIIFQIDDIIYDFLSIKELNDYLKQIIDSIYLSEEAIEYIYQITEICVRFQLFNMIGFCLKKIELIIGEKKSEKYNLYQYIKMFQGEEYELLLETIEENRKRETTNAFNSYSLLFEIVTYRAMNEIDKYTELVNKTNQNESFKQTIYYGYFLRLAEAYDKRNLAIPKVEKSIKIFEKANMPFQVSKSRISLAFLYAISGRINDAQRELDLSKKYLQKNIENKYIFNINKACISILSNDFSEDIWDLLDEAEKYTHMRFDQIAIIINKLIICIENCDFDRGLYLQNKGLDLLELESDKHIHAIFYYNCYKFNKLIGNKDKEEFFYKRAYFYREYCETLKARLEGKNTVSDNTTFLLTKPWHVCFVSYWYFDYLEDLS